jgi:GrpB-like predicted nucleotidyltransferase (UPF0157 family)
VAKLELAEYDAAWAERFLAEAQQIRRALGDLVVDVEHVGSTSVPGLAGKPTVDIAVGATTIDLPRDAVRRMEKVGFEHADHPDRPWVRNFRKGLTFPREVIVHVVEWGGPHWHAYLRFRDALRADPALAGEYERLKRRLLRQLGEWYSGRDKEELIGRVLRGTP